MADLLDPPDATDSSTAAASPTTGTRPAPQIPGLEGYDPTQPMTQQSDHVKGTLPPGAPALPTYIHDVQGAGPDTDPAATTASSQPTGALPTPSTPAATAPGSGSAVPSIPGLPSSGTSTTTPATPKPYSVDPQSGAVKFDSTQPATSLLTAYKDGAVGDDDMKTLLPKAQAAEQAQAEQQRVTNENPAAWKAFASGAASNTAFLAGAAPGAGVGTEIGAGLGALGGPFAEITVPAGAAIGNIAGGYIGGKLASSALDAAVSKLGEYNATIRSFQDASAIHPYWNAAGGVVSAAAGIPKAGMQAVGQLIGGEGAAGETAAAKLGDALQTTRAAEDIAPTIDKAATLKSILSPSNLRQAAAQGFDSGGGGLGATISNLTQEAAIRAAQGASTADIAKIIGYRVGGASLGMLALDTALKESSKALGLSPDGQTIPGAVQSALIGAFMAGHPLAFGETQPTEMASIMSRVYARQKAGVGMGDTLTPDQMPGGVDGAQAAVLSQPLTPRELVLSSSFEDQVRGMVQRGEIQEPQTGNDFAQLAQGATGREVFQNGRRQATAVTIKPLASVTSQDQTGSVFQDSAAATPLSLPFAQESASPSQQSAAQGQSETQAALRPPTSSGPLPQPSVPSAALRGLATSGPASPVPTSPAPTGQAQPAATPTPQDDDLRQRIADTQTALEHFN